MAVLRAALGPVGQIGATLPIVPTGVAFGIEWLLSFVLMFVIMAVATDDRVAEGFAALAVGLTVGFCAMMGGPLTGVSMHPARSLGPGRYGRGIGCTGLAPVTAIIAAARVYEFLRASKSPRGDARPLGVEGPITS